MKTRLVRIGNSRGVRIPKPLLLEAGLTDDTELELEATPDQVVLRPVRTTRQGWRETFAAMAKAGDDVLVATPSARFDRTEWRW